jgi:hypothetical protein
MQNDFARHRAFNANHAQAITNFIAIGNSRKPARCRMRKSFRSREDWNRELVRKLNRSTMVIGARHDNARNTAGNY